jgi:hypothetical protein
VGDPVPLNALLPSPGLFSVLAMTTSVVRCGSAVAFRSSCAPSPLRLKTTVSIHRPHAPFPEIAMSPPGAFMAVLPASVDFVAWNAAESVAAKKSLDSTLCCNLIRLNRAPSRGVATLGHLGMGTDERLRNLEELTRYVLAIVDLQDAARGARYLAEAPWLALAPPVRRCLITGTFASYWRPFTNKGYGRLPEPALSEDQKRVHAWAGKQRNRIWAHTTPGSTRIVELDGAPRVTRGSIRIKSVPPVKREYFALADLADHLAERYQAVLDK